MLKKLTSLLIAAVLILSCTVVAMAANAPAGVRETEISADVVTVAAWTNSDSVQNFKAYRNVTMINKLEYDIIRNGYVADGYGKGPDGNTQAEGNRYDYICSYYMMDISGTSKVTNASLNISVAPHKWGTFYVLGVDDAAALYTAAEDGKTTNVVSTVLPQDGKQLASRTFGTSSQERTDCQFDVTEYVNNAIDAGKEKVAFKVYSKTNNSTTDYNLGHMVWNTGTYAPKLVVKSDITINANAQFVEEKTVKILATQANSGATDKDNPTENVLALGTWGNGQNQLIVNSSSDKRIFYQFDLSPYIGKIQKAELKVMFNTKKWDLIAMSEATTEAWDADTICYDTMPKTSGNVVDYGYGTSYNDKWLSFDHTNYIKSMDRTNAIFGAAVYAKPGSGNENTTSIAKVYGVNHSGYSPYLEITYTEEATAFNSEGIMINCSVDSNFGTARPIVALFNGETLIDTIIYDEMDLSVSNSLIQAITAEELAGATSAKLFLWESLRTLMPLCVNDEL